MFSPVVVKTAAQTALNFVLSLTGRLFKNQKADSLVRFTKSTRVEPIALVDQRLSHLPYMPDIMQALSSIFTGYYLQAAALAVNVGRINVIRLLDALNPSRDVQDAAATRIVTSLNTPSTESLLSMESYVYSLPVPEPGFGMEAFGVEASAWNHPAAQHAYQAAQKQIDETLKDPKFQKVGADIKATQDMTNFNKDGKSNATIGDGDLSKFVNEAVNLSVGKMVEVTIDDDGKKATFPIMIRLITTIVASNVLVHILADGSRWLASAKERYHAWRAGQLEFVRDLVLCQDLIDEHRKALLQDKTGVYKEILSRRAGNATASFLSGNPSIATASNLLVLSKQTAKELEREIGGRLNNKAVRDRLFDKTYVMLMVIVDPEWEQVEIYHRGIALPTELSLKELKTANKGSGPDVGEILKAYQLGQNPTI